MDGLPLVEEVVGLLMGTKKLERQVMEEEAEVGHQEVGIQTMHKQTQVVAQVEVRVKKELARLVTLEMVVQES